MNKDIECKHKELQNLMRIQEHRSRHSNIRIDGIVESSNENGKDTKNDLHQMLCDYFDITEGVIIKTAHRVEKQDKIKQGPLTIVAKLKNTHYLKDVNIYVYRDFKGQTIAIYKPL